MAKAHKEAVQVVKVSQDGSRLVTADNQTLYRFVPQRYNPNYDKHDPKHPNGIPWMADFPGYMKDWMETWSPLTGKPMSGYKGSNKFGLTQDDFSSTERLGGPKLGESQIMFRGWYLYTYTGDRPETINGEVMGLWQKASPDLKPLSEYKDPSVTLEAFYGGP